MIEESLRYGDTDIIYHIAYIDSSKKKIVIHVHPDRSVQVDAPFNTELNDIKRAVQKRARWLQNHLSNIDKQYSEVLPREYVSGESHLYLGRRYVLKVFARPSAAGEVKCWRGRLEVSLPERDPVQVKKNLQDWYRRRAQIVFDRRLRELCEGLPWVKQIPRVRLRTMRKQWGSCSPSGDLLVNTHLVKAPVRCIDYVLLHELCHLKHHNHSKGFYRLLHKYYPGWESVKGHLDGMAELLLNE